MRKVIVLALALLAAAAVGVAQARADASASVSVWAEAGDGSTAPIDQRLSDGGPTAASTGFGWPAASVLTGGSCPATGCASRNAGATASVDESAGKLRAGAAASVLVGNAPSSNYGADAYVTSEASFDDSITLSQPATVVLEGTVHGSMSGFNADDYWANDPRVTSSVSLGFQTGGGPIPRVSSFWGATDGFDATYEPTIAVGCHDASASCMNGTLPGTDGQPIEDSFSIPVDLPAGTTPISGDVKETVSLLVDGEPNVVLAQDGLLDLGNTVTFQVVVPDGVVATSGSGELPIVGGAAAADTTPPVTSATVSPAPNAAGWNRGPVTVQLTAADEDGGSGVAGITYSATGANPLPETTTAGGSVPVAIDAEGVTTLTYHATDATGNAEAPQTLTVRIDGTPPSITVPADGVVADATSTAGAAVSYEASVQDDLDPAPSLDCEPASGSTFPIGQTTVTCTAADAAGNQATASFAVTVRGAADQIADELTSAAGGLGAKQQAALADVQAGRTPAACGVLGAYANQVRALAGKKLPAGDAARLLETAGRVQTLLGC